MADDKLAKYRRMRDAARTPEPVPAETAPEPVGNNDTFVIQEHHARSLHWDFRLERDGVLVSWAVPRNLPPDPKTNHLAVHTEDHPLEYARFHGEIPRGEYGGGTMKIWDRGRYETEKWNDREVMVVVRGERVSGRYVLFRTGGKNWMAHRMDPPSDPDWRALPTSWNPVLAVDRARFPRDQDGYAFEFDWGGTRAAAFISGGRVIFRDAAGVDVTKQHSALRAAGEWVDCRQLILDGEIVTIGGTETFLAYDILHADGHDLTGEPHARRREILDDLEYAGSHWQTSPSFPGPGAAIRDAAREQGLPAVLAKLRTAPYAATHPWLRIPC